MAKIQYRDSKGHFRNPSNYDGDLYTHVDGIKVKVKSAGEGRLDKRQVRKATQKQRESESWQKKSDANEIFREEERRKREEEDKVKSSHGLTTATFIGAEEAHKLKLQKEKKEETYRKKGNEIIRTTDSYNQSLYQQSKKLAETNPNQTVYNETEQANIVNLFIEANNTMVDWEENYGITVGRGFHLYKSDTVESIEKKIDRALEVTGEEYLQKLALSYKLDFISNFANHVQGEDFARFVDGVTKMDNLDFLKLIKDKHIDFLAYALDSIVDRHGFEQILADINYLTDRINEKLKGA